jgi:hypothetical protein
MMMMMKFAREAVQEAHHGSPVNIQPKKQLLFVNLSGRSPSIVHFWGGLKKYK